MNLILKKKICFVSVDIEHDFGSPYQVLPERTWKGVENLGKILDVFERHNISATLFITGQALERYPELVKQWSKNYEIACHSFAHSFWNKLNLEARKNDLEDFIGLYQRIFKTLPCGFRAPSHIIDEQGMKLLESKRFLYDSSIVPRFPFFMKYRGYKKKAPLLPYHPSYGNCRKKGNMQILELPVSGLILGIPLWGGSLRHVPFRTYKDLLKAHSPKFLTLSMHSWDAVFFKGKRSKNSGEKFLKLLEKMISLLEKQGYKFLNGKEITEKCE